MNESKRATIYFDADVHSALRLRAAAWHRSTSKMANEAVRMTLAKAADDLRDANQWQNVDRIGFEEFVISFRRRGRILSYAQAISGQAAKGKSRCRNLGSVD
jgi:hypothetical protein